MKKLIAFVLALAGTLPLLAYTPEVKDVDISVVLSTDGSALITERWDVVVARGTEWYLVRNNLGDIEISDLEVVDENGNVFLNDGRWDVDRSISQKARRCGLHNTSEGMEICWGVESYGPHTWTVRYRMSNVVKTLDDHDALHMQFVSDGLSSPPQHVNLQLEAPVALTDRNSNIWGFGCNGELDWHDGKVVAYSTEPFDDYSSLILLIRFDKGIFNSPSIRHKSFDDQLEEAMEGNTYTDSDRGDDEDPVADALSTIIAILVTWFAFLRPVFFGPRKKKNQTRKRIFGTKKLPEKPDWNRTIPFDGDFRKTYYVASHMGGEDDKKLSIVQAILLRMVQRGVILMHLDSKGKKVFSFQAADKSYMTPAERSFYMIMEKAAGSDRTLQQKEFDRWCSSHRSEITTWVSKLQSEVQVALSASALASGSDYQSLTFNADGQKKANESLGFLQYLKDFTIIEERQVPEVALWGDYLVVASLFGIADQVAKDMNKLAPNISIGTTNMSMVDYGDILTWSDVFRTAARSAYTYKSYSSGSYGGGSYGGGGGSFSRGGGGGFSGGGRGGGSR